MHHAHNSCGHLHKTYTKSSQSTLQSRWGGALLLVEELLAIVVVDTGRLAMLQGVTFYSHTFRYPKKGSGECVWVFSK